MDKGNRWLSIIAALLLVIAGAALTPGGWHRMLWSPRVDSTPPVGLGPPQVPVLRQPFAFSAELDGARYGELPPSAWQQQQRAIWRALLAAGGPQQYDLLLVPVQGFPADQALLDGVFKQIGRTSMLQRSLGAVTLATRSRMSTVLAERMVVGPSRQRLPDPMMVRRALGEELRVFSDEDVHALADALDVSTVVSVHVGHLPPRHLVVHVHIYKKGADTQLTFGPLAFSDTELPEDLFAGFADQIIAALPPVAVGGRSGTVATSEESAQATTPGNTAGLPALPEALAHAVAPDSPDGVRALQLYGLLAPSAPRRTSERFFERSLALLERIDPSRSERLLRARALFHLGRRPAALAVLGHPVTPEERALRALMDGDDASMGTEAARIDNPFEAFIARVEQLTLLDEYDARVDLTERIGALASEYGHWTPLLWNRLTENNTWKIASNLLLAGELERVYPLVGYSLRERLAIGGAVAPASEVEIARLAFEHGARIIARDGRQFCCDLRLPALVQTDYLELLLAQVESNVLRQVDHQLSTQGSPERALEMIEQLRPVFDGHPALAALEAEALYASAGQEDGLARRNKLQRSAVAAIDAVNWSGGQSMHAARALSVAFRVIAEAVAAGMQRDMPPGLQHVDSAYESDFPPLADWDREFPSAANGVGLTGAWDYEHASIYPLYARLNDLAGSGRQDEADALMAANEHRFKSDPMRSYFLASYLQRTGRVERAAELHREAVESGTQEWTSYFEYGSHLMRAGRYAEAAVTFLRYPGFGADSSVNPVAVANYAYDAGSELYWHGEHETAGRLFRIAARLGTGSGASMASAQRLAQLERDWSAAKDHARARAERYGDMFAYRDLLGLQFATGESADAWPLFDALAVRVVDIGPWFAAHVGLRIEGKTEAEIADWIRARRELVAERTGVDVLVKFGLLALVLDRVPGDAAYDAMTGIGLTGSSVPPVAALMRAYSAARRADWNSAWSALDGIRQSTGPGPGTYSTEWTALVGRIALRSGNRDVPATLLERLEGKAAATSEARFAAQLVRADVDAAEGSIDASVRDLRSAHGLMPITTDWALHPWYQLLETTEFLFLETGDARYRELLVAWAGSLQRILPTVSWGYVFAACYSTDARERREALGVALYLDRHSARLGAIDKAVRDEAASDFARRRPFESGPRTETPANASVVSMSTASVAR